MKTKFFLMITALMVISFASCKKDASLPGQSGINLANDDAVSEAVFEDVSNSVDITSINLDNMMKNGDSKSTSLAGDSCPEISVTHPSSGIWPKVLTVDYGSGCVGFYDNTRSGKIIIEVTGPRRDEGSKRTVTFENYYFNGIKVEGTKVFENLGLNGNQNYVISVKLTDGKLILPDGKTIERSFDRQREWTAGFLTKNIWDDECLITGTSNGRNSEGISYTGTILTALHWKRVCRFIVSGIISIDRDGKEPFELDYGTGECDSKATVTSGGESKEILLRHIYKKF